MFSPGSKIYVRQFRKLGEIIEGPNRRGEYLLSVGSLNIWVAESGLSMQKEEKKNSSIRRRPRKTGQKMQAKVFSLDLHGFTVEEALRAVEDLISSALLDSISQLEIIHGLGTGALQRALHSYLAKCRHVTSFALHPSNKGTTLINL